MKQITKNISKNTLKRLFQYRLCLIRFKKLGFDKVFSYNLGEEAGVSPEQVRKDFSECNLKGNKKGGYIIDELMKAIDHMFEYEENQYVIVIGMGNIGQALAQYKRFANRRMVIVAAFDIDPFKQKRKFGVPVHSIDSLEEIINEYQVRIAIISVPEISAQEVCDLVVSLGVVGILNFAPILLKVPVGIVVNNVNLCDELESVIYYAHRHLESDKK